jgi:hypothetical protein
MGNDEFRMTKLEGMTNDQMTKMSRGDSELRASALFRISSFFPVVRPILDLELQHQRCAISEADLMAIEPALVRRMSDLPPPLIVPFNRS